MSDTYTKRFRMGGTGFMPHFWGHKLKAVKIDGKEHQVPEQYADFLKDSLKSHWLVSWFFVARAHRRAGVVFRCEQLEKMKKSRISVVPGEFDLGVLY